ncbi:MAG: ATP-dependent zinc metalloprotease FtsH 2 [Gemmatales bacterium]|nr:MAG: ATP-dependent zinc metalloprotease FtsH 2 [Gemmatales bacterium]
MQKKKKEGSRSPWLSHVHWIIVGVILLMWWGGSWFVDDATTVTLDLGALKDILADKSLSFEDVKLDRGVITGKIVTRDPVSGAAEKEASRAVAFQTRRLESDPTLIQLLDEHGIPYEVAEEQSAVRALYSMLLTLLFFVACGMGMFFLIRWLAGGSSPFSVGRSRHKLYAESDLKVTFNDVAGIDEAVAELREVVDFLKTPQKYQALGGRIPKGVLLVGPPGTGKTLLAKAVAGEAGVPFFSLSGSDFVEMFVGVGAARVRDLFAHAESQAPCIVFIDELDALGKSRSGVTVGGHDEREQTLNQLLVEMDGFDSNRGVILMAATNRPETLDAALLRPGRFDRTVVVDRPDVVGREAILRVHVRNVRLAPDVDLRRAASLTPGSVGADLANLVNEAALLAARNNRDAVTMADIDEAIERGTVGLKRQSRIMQDDEKQRVAYHEAGHALVACALPNTTPVHKISIIPRGTGALGYVLRRPEDDRYLMTQSELESHIKVALGGTIAEELIFREISNGATSDLQEANRIARSMVCEFGMSRLGRVYYRAQPHSSFLPVGNDSESTVHSEQTAREIDEAVREIIEEASEEVRTILQSRRSTLEAVARQLVEKEVIDGDELKELIAQHDPRPKIVPGTIHREARCPIDNDKDDDAPAATRQAETGERG